MSDSASFRPAQPWFIDSDVANRPKPSKASPSTPNCIPKYASANRNTRIPWALTFFLLRVECPLRLHPSVEGNGPQSLLLGLSS